MAQFHLGPLTLRMYGGENWSSFEAAIVTNRNGGMAARETALRASFRSDHLIEACGTENPADVFEDPATGTVYFGRLTQTPTGVHTISAKEVFTKALYERAVKAGLRNATESTDKVTAAAAAS